MSTCKENNKSPVPNVWKFVVVGFPLLALGHFVRQDETTFLQRVSNVALWLIFALLGLPIIQMWTTCFLQWCIKRCYDGCEVAENKQTGQVDWALVLHHFIRDSGLFDWVMSILSLENVGYILRRHPNVVRRSLHLWRRRKIVRYGPSTSQKVEVFFPETTKSHPSNRPLGLIFFVHGGAWGSGDPSMYRLLATGFLEMNWAVGIVGYRTYPSGDASTQIDDYESALIALEREYPALFLEKIIAIGHSSGAHIVLLSMVERARKRIEYENVGHQINTEERQKSIRVDSLILLSAPLNIVDHFKFETGRGVEQISPMQPACGNSQEMFLRYSPAVAWSQMYQKQTTEVQQQFMKKLLPPITFVHGMGDGTVPPSSTEEAARVLKMSGVSDCREIYVDDIEHEEVIMQVMLGGPIKEIVTSLVRLAENS